jgi:hypothetical protein
MLYTRRNLRFRDFLASMYKARVQERKALTALDTHQEGTRVRSIGDRGCPKVPVGRAFAGVFRRISLVRYPHQVSYTWSMKASTQAALRLDNEEVIELICSRGYFSLAAQLRLCLTCELSCPGIRNCPVHPLCTPSGVDHFPPVPNRPSPYMDRLTACVHTS